MILLRWLSSVSCSARRDRPLPDEPRTSTLVSGTLPTVSHTAHQLRLDRPNEQQAGVFPPIWAGLGEQSQALLPLLHQMVMLLAHNLR
jgi:hypothetical protein